MREALGARLDEWLGRAAGILSGAASLQAFWLYGGGAPLLPWPLVLATVGLLVLAAGRTLVLGAPEQRAVTVVFLVALANHLSITQSLLPHGPTSVAEVQSRLAGELGRVTLGFPLRAMLATVGAVAWGYESHLWLGGGRLGVALGFLVGLLGVLCVLGYATGSLAGWMS